MAHMLTRGAIQALGEGAQGEYTVQVVNIELGDLQKGEPNRLVISDGETSRTALLASPLSPFHVIQIQEYSRNPQGEVVIGKFKIVQLLTKPLNYSSDEEFIPGPLPKNLDDIMTDTKSKFRLSLKLILSEKYGRNYVSEVYKVATKFGYSLTKDPLGKFLRAKPAVTAQEQYVSVYHALVHLLGSEFPHHMFENSATPLTKNDPLPRVDISVPNSHDEPTPVDDPPNKIAQGWLELCECFQFTRPTNFEAHEPIQVDPEASNVQDEQEQAPVLFETQMSAAKEMSDRLEQVLFQDVSADSRKTSQVEIFFLLPSLNSLEMQTRERLSQFASHFLSDLPDDYWDDKVIKLSSSASVIQEEILERISREQDTFFIFLQDECHWGPQDGSMASSFTQAVLNATKHSAVVGVSATPENQLTALVNRRPELGIQDRIVRLQSPSYFGREKFLQYPEKIFQSPVPKKNAIALSYLCSLMDFPGEETGASKWKYNRELRDKFKLDILDKDTHMVLSQLLSTSEGGGGLAVLRLDKVETAVDFSRRFSEILMSRFPQTNLTVCYSVSEKGSRGDDCTVTCCNFNMLGMHFGNLLDYRPHSDQPAACLLVVVMRGRMGDTFSGAFRYYDMRDSFKSTPDWAPFHQCCGRAFGYGERPDLLINKKAYGILNDPAKAKSADSTLVKRKSTGGGSQGDWDYSDFYIEDHPSQNPFHRECTIDDLVRELEESGKHYAIWNRTAYLNGVEPTRTNCVKETPDVVYYFAGVGRVHNMISPQQYSTRSDFSLPFEPDWTAEPDSVQDTLDALVRQYDLGRKHAGKKEQFLKTFDRRIFLVAEPQMGKTGAMLALVLELASNFTLAISESTPPKGYPKLKELRKLARQTANRGKHSFDAGKYGGITLLDSRRSLPGYQVNKKGAKDMPRTLIIQRLDYTTHSSEVSRTTRSTPPDLIPDNFCDSGALLSGGMEVFIPQGLSFAGEKPPLFFISSGRAHVKEVNLNWNPTDGRRQVLAVRLEEYKDYYETYQDTHTFLLLRGVNMNVGMIRANLVQVANHLRAQWIWLLDDNLSKIEYRKIGDDSSPWEGQPSFMQVIEFIEEPCWKERSEYALISPGKDSRYQRPLANPFSVQSGKGMALLNVQRLMHVGINYEPIRVAEDLELAFHLCVKGELTCRFNRFAVHKNQIKQGGCAQDTTNYLSLTDRIEDDKSLWNLVDQILPRCPENSYLLPRVYSTGTTSSLGRYITSQLGDTVTGAFIEDTLLVRALLELQKAAYPSDQWVSIPNSLGGLIHKLEKSLSSDMPDRQKVMDYLQTLVLEERYEELTQWFSQVRKRSFFLPWVGY